MMSIKTEFIIQTIAEKRGGLNNPDLKSQENAEELFDQFDSGGGVAYL